MNRTSKIHDPELAIALAVVVIAVTIIVYAACAFLEEIH